MRDLGVAAAAFLADGRIAFGTLRGGLVVCSAAGEVLQRIDRSHGLPSDDVAAVCEDTEGGIWLALANGVARVQLGSPFALHSAAQRFEGTPRVMTHFAGSLYVGHSAGLARRSPEGKFERVPGMADYVSTLSAHENRLYATGQRLSVVRPTAPRAGSPPPITAGPWRSAAHRACF